MHPRQVAYTLVWIIITSELGYYSKLYGPQVLLQLNLAYFLPSIPVLLVLGQVKHPGQAAPAGSPWGSVPSHTKAQARLYRRWGSNQGVCMQALGRQGACQGPCGQASGKHRKHSSRSPPYGED